MGMPMTKQIAIVASRMKMSIGLPFTGSLERRGFRMLWYGLGRAPEKDAFDDEEQEKDPADRYRQIGDADREERKIGDAVVPGPFDQPLAPDDHEDRDQRHQELDDEIEQFSPGLRQLVG